MTTIRWGSYYKRREGKPPRPLLVKALSFVNDELHKEALDIGAGTLNDTIYLLDEGWNVNALDSSKEFLTYANQISSPKLKVINLPIEQYEFDRSFSLINAQFVLPFLSKETFNETFKRMLSSLEQGGVFCGQFFGIKDEWNTPTSELSFHTEEEIRGLLQGTTIKVFNEEEEDKATALGKMKHWHIYHIIVIKK